MRGDAGTVPDSESQLAGCRSLRVRPAEGEEDDVVSIDFEFTDNKAHSLFCLGLSPLWFLHSSLRS